MPPSGLNDDKASKPRKKATLVDGPERRRWEAATEGVLSVHASPYRDEDTYQVGDILLDKRHGMGVVEAVDDDAVLTVLFRDGLERLPSQRD